ncbi:hypothetical protein SUGI_0758730 [Cryptomeria japonica]|nr:hypothetical protein SUGI_0758730 [Cryptomeria japonica]
MAMNVSKMKSILKKCQSFGTSKRSYSNVNWNPMFHDDVNEEADEISVPDYAEGRPSSLIQAGILDEVPKGCKAVYVGKSRRRYFISAHYLNHPLLRVLLHRCEKDNEEQFSVCCEVVMFEHLVWMLENADFSDSFEELVEFYSSN